MKFPASSSKLIVSLILGASVFGLFGLAASLKFTRHSSAPLTTATQLNQNTGPQQLAIKPVIAPPANTVARQTSTAREQRPTQRSNQRREADALMIEPRAPQVDNDEGEREGREDWFYEQRAYPEKTIPHGARMRAVEQLEEVMTRRRLSGAQETAAADPLIWTSLGPQPIAQGQTSGSPRVSVSGRISALALHPQYDGTTNQTVYIGGAQGGVWRSTDDGANWTPLTDSQPSLAMGAIAIDPGNSNIIYAGTGEGNSSGDSYYGAGLLKSTDGGQSWMQITGPTSTLNPQRPAFINASFTKITVDPSNSSIVYVCTRTGSTSGSTGGAGGVTIGQRGVWKSKDGGQTWINLDPSGSGGGTSATDLIIDPQNPNRIYAALLSVGIYRSTTGGESVNGQPAWEKLGDTLPTTGFTRTVLTTGPPLSPSTNATLFAAIAASDSSLVGVYVSTDTGTTWTKTTSTPPTGQASYNLALVADPTDSNILYYGTQNSVYRSTNGGASWTNVGSGNGSTGGLHADTHVLAICPTNRNILFVGSDGGMWRTNNATATTIGWNTLNQTLSLTQFQGLALHPTDPNLVIGGTQDNGTNIYTGTTSWTQSIGGDGGITVIDQSNPQVMYHTFFNQNNATSSAQIGPQRSLNGGASWSNRGCFGCSTTMGNFNPADRVGFYVPMAQHVGFTGTSGNVIYVGTHRLYRTDDQGGTWTGLGASSDGFGMDLTKGVGRLSAIAAHPVLGTGTPPSELVWIGTNDGNVQFTANAGALANATFTNVTKAPLPNRFVTDIALDLVNQQRAIVTYSGFNTNTPTTPGHIFETINQGASWTDISGDLPDVPVTSIAIDTARTGTYYIGTDLGVFRTTNGGVNWTLLSTGMPKVASYMVRYHEASGNLYVATHGRGIYRMAVARQTASAHGASFASGLAKETIASAFGNGLANTTAFASSLPLPTNLGGTTVKLRDSAGVEQLAPLFFASSLQVNYLIPANVAPGPITTIITSGDGTVSIGRAQVSAVAPGLFTKTSNGQGVPAADVLRVKANGAQIYEPIGQFTGGQWVTTPIDLSPAGDIVFLSLYGTGLRNRSSLSAVKANIGGVITTLDAAKFEYAGPAPGFVGLDQVNVQIPRSLIGRGEVDLLLTVDGKNTNTVRVNFK